MEMKISINNKPVTPEEVEEEIVAAPIDAAILLTRVEKLEEQIKLLEAKI